MNAQRPDFSSMSSEELTTQLHSLVADERRSIVGVIWHLDELERRKELGLHRNIFDYCNRKLGLSNGCSFYRSHAVRIFRRFPVAATYLSDGRVSLKKLVLLEDVFTDENVVRLLDTASRSTEDQVKRLIATARPSPTVPDSIRTLRPPRSPSTSPGEVSAASVPTPTSTPVQASPQSSSAEARAISPDPIALTLFTDAPPKPRRRDVTRALNQRETEFAFTCDDEFLAHFAQAKSLLSHKLPRGTHAEVLGECLRIAVDVMLKKKLGVGSTKGKRPTASKNAATDVSDAAAAGSAANARSAVTSPGEVRRGIEGFTSPGEVRRGIDDSTSPGEVRLANGNSTSPGEVSDGTENCTSPGEVRLATEDSTSPDEVRRGVEDSTSPGEVPMSPRDEVIVPSDLFDRPSRYVPKEIVRKIWERDGGCCAVVMDDGTRCASTFQVQIDHHGTPYSLGGPATEPNLRLACAAHNRFFAEQLFGRCGRNSAR